MPIPIKYKWETLTNKSGDELEAHYNNLLRELAKEKGKLGQLFIKSQSLKTVTYYYNNEIVKNNFINFYRPVSYQTTFQKIRRSSNYFYSVVWEGFLFLILILPAKNLLSQNNHIGLPSAFSASNGFIENRGQIKNQFHQRNTEVKYLLHANGMNVQLKKNGFSYDTYEVLSGSSVAHERNLTGTQVKKTDSTVYRFHRIDVELTGANPSPQIIALGKSANYAIYFTPGHMEGDKVYNFSHLIYREIYHGIDLLFDTRIADGQKGFEYYFIIKPGADANQIKLKYTGAATKLRNNRIIIHSVNGVFEEKIPVSFLSNEDGPVFSQQPNTPTVKVVYEECSKGVFKFAVPKYDKTKKLIIDPTPDLVWGTYYGGSINDWAYCIDKDPSGNILVGGASNNADLATAGAYQITLTGYADAMVGKFKNNGDLLWITYLGGELEDQAFGICSDNNGNIFVTGITDSKTGIATPGSYQTVHGDTLFGRDAFLVKFNAAGNRIWGTYYGGKDVDFLHGIQADANGNIYAAGWTQSADGISSIGAYQPNYVNSSNPLDWGDGFIVCFDNNGNRTWATYYGGSSFDRFYDIALDNNGNIYASGIAYSNGLSSAGAFQPTLGGGLYDALIVKFNNRGNRVWATYYGGDNEDYFEAITCDNQNNIIIGGMTISTTNIATTGTYLPSFAGGTRDGFVVKFNENGNRVWGTYYGGNGEEMIYGITSDVNNNIIIGGWTYSSNNIATANAYASTFPGTVGVWTPFLAKLNSSGNRLWGTYYGYGSMYGNGEAEDLVADNSGNIFVCGETMAPSGIATCNAVQKTWGGNQDMFVAMFSETISSATVSATITSDQTDSVCAGAPVTFTAVAINGGAAPSYQWLINNINSGVNNPVFITNSLNNGDQVSCTVTSNSPCITNPVAKSNVVAVSIRPSVIPAISITSSTTGNICPGSSVTFTASTINGGSRPSYQWKINGNNVGTNNPVFVTNTLANGDVIYCMLINLASCNVITSAVSDNLTINVAPIVTPTISITESTKNACAGEPVTFTASVLNAGNNPSYQWKVNGNPAGNNNLTFNTSTLSNNDTVQCFLTPGNIGCTNSTNIASNKSMITIYPLPVFTIQPDKPVISKGDTVQLSILGINISKYKWKPGFKISNDTINNPMVWPENTQAYDVEVISEKGCISSKQIIVSVITKIFVPNAFTPNNDGINDYWEIKGLELYPDCHISIFDRWGNIIYQSNGLSKPWDGTFKGRKLPTSVFVYNIDFKNGKSPLLGTLTLLR